MSAKFSSDHNTFLALNALRVVASGFAWVIVISDLTPGVLRAAAHAEVAARLQAEAASAASRPLGPRGQVPGDGVGRESQTRGVAVMRQALREDDRTPR